MSNRRGHGDSAARRVLPGGIAMGSREKSVLSPNFVNVGVFVVADGGLFWQRGDRRSLGGEAGKWAESAGGLGR